MTFKKHIIKGICAVFGCGRKTHKTKMCSTCRSKVTRAKDPVKYAYYNKKHNAAKKGKPFTITLAYFRAWCAKVKYIGFTGRKADSYTIDCIINDLGYVPGNLQVLTNRDNVKKYFTYDYKTKTVTEIKGGAVENKNDLPF